MKTKWFSYITSNGSQSVVNLDHITWIGKFIDGDYGFTSAADEDRDEGEFTLTPSDYARLLKTIGVEQVAPTHHDTPTQ